VSGFAQALPMVLTFEGGYVDDPVDRGGATNFGVTQAAYDRYRTSIGQPTQPVKEITDAEVAAIYERDYWRASHCDSLPWPASLAHFDAAVNHGPLRAAYMLQEALGVAADGKVGPKTLAAVASIDPRVLMERLLWIRVRFYQSISAGDQIKFLRGWLARVLELRKVAA